MKKVTRLESNNLSQWDLFVENHPYGSIYHLSGWKQALEKNFGHIKGKFLVVWDDELNKIIAGLPIYAVRSFLTGNRLVSVPMACQGTPLVSTKKDMEMIAAHLFNLYKKEQTSYIEIRSSMHLSHIMNSEFGISNFYKGHYILLDREPELLKKSFHKKSVRVPISKALKNGLELKHGKNESDLISFYDIFFRSRKSLGMPLIPYNFFKTLWDVFESSNQLTVLLAVFEGKVVGSALLLKFKQTVTVEYGCDLIEYRKLCINHFLDWESIKLAYNEGYKIFHFGRTSLNNEGLLTYKKRWGTKSADLPNYYFPEDACSRDNENKTSLKYNLIRTVLKNSPTPIFQILSNLISHHMG